MKVTIINGSPRRNGNTSALTSRIKSFLPECDVKEIHIFNMSISGCSNCQSCSRCDPPGKCSIDDDMSTLYKEFDEADVMILASPIYMWQMTPATLAFLNRLHCLCRSSDFSFNKMEGKRIALALTMGDEGEVADFAVNGIIEFCKFFKISYLGDCRIEYADDAILKGLHDERIKDFVENLL